MCGQSAGGGLSEWGQGRWLTEFCGFPRYTGWWLRERWMMPGLLCLVAMFLQQGGEVDVPGSNVLTAGRGG